MNLANLPDIVSEKILMFAAEKEYLDFFHKQKGRKMSRRYCIGKWMEILYKFAQVLPQWKDTIFRSKMLFEHDIEENEEPNSDDSNRDYPEKWDSVHSLDFSTGRVKIYKGKRTLNLETICLRYDDYTRVCSSIVQDGYTSLAKHMCLGDEDLDAILDLADTSSIESYEVTFNDPDISLPKFVEILNKSKNANRVDASIVVGLNNPDNQSIYEHLMEILQVATIKHAKFNPRWTPDRPFR